jgi:competence protein ComEC
MEDNREKPRRIPRSSARVVAMPRSWGFPVEWQFLDGRAWLSKNIAQEIEQRRLFPWIAVFFGIGIVLFFQAEGRRPSGHRLEPLQSAAQPRSPFDRTSWPFLS